VAKLATVTPMGTGVWPGAELTTAQDLTNLGIRRNAAMRTLWFEASCCCARAPSVSGSRVTTSHSSRSRRRGRRVRHHCSRPRDADGHRHGRDDRLVSGADRLADGDTNGGFAIELEDLQGFAPIAPDRLRAPVAGLQGTLRTVFYRQLHGGG